MAETIQTALYMLASDASAYKAGMAEKVAADQRAISSGEQLVASEERVTRATRLSAEAIDRKIARLDPIYAAQLRYTKVLELTRRYEEEGIGTAEQRARLLALETERYRKIVSPIDDLGQSAKNTSYLTKQLGFQLVDIAQGVPLAFQSPLYGLQNLAIQTGQVAQLYAGQGGLKQALSDTAAIAGRFGERARSTGALMLAGLATPAGLATAGVTAIGVAVAATAAIIISRLPDADRAIAEHERAIKDIRKAWAEAAKGPEEYRGRAIEEMRFLTTQDLRTQQELLNQQLNGALGLGRATGGGLIAQLSQQSLVNQASIAFTAQQRAMRDFQPAIDAFFQSVKDGKPDVDGLNAAITKTANEHPEVAYQKAAAELRSWTKEATATAERIRDLNRAYGDFRIGAAFDAAGQGPTPADQAARDLALARQRHAADLAAVGARTPGQLAGVARLREQATPLSENESPEGRNFRIAAAAALAYAQAVESINRQTEDLRLSADASKALMEAYQSAPETVEEVRRHFELLSEAQSAGIDVNTAVGQAWFQAADDASRLNDELSKAASLFEETRTPLEEYAARIRDLRQLLADGAIGQQQFGRAAVMAGATIANQYGQIAGTIGQALGTIFEDSKAVSIANALINTYQGITQALAHYPPPFSYAMAAAQAALGFAQVAKIRSQSRKGGGGASSGIGGTAAGANAGNTQPQPARTVVLSFKGSPDDKVSVKDVRAQLEELSKLTADGAKLVVEAA